MPIKVIQICTGDHDNVCIFALCDDGKIFTLNTRSGNQWYEIQAIPQD